MKKLMVIIADLREVRKVRFTDMTSADIERAAERHYDRMLDQYQQEDAWDHYDPDWTEVCDIINYRDEQEIAGLVRDYIEGDGDLWCEICEAGLLEGYIPPENAWMMKDPDDEWKLVEPIFDKHWDDDEFMVRIWDGFEKVRQGVCEGLKEKADRGDADDIREKYNDNIRERAEAWEEWNEEHRRAD